MKATLVVLLATLALAVVLGPRAMDALQERPGGNTTPNASPAASLSDNRHANRSDDDD